MSAEFDAGMTVIVKTIAAVLVIPVIVFGLYVVLHGHLTPGGGFAGGTVIATLAALLLVAFGKDFAKIKARRELLASTESLGLALFATLALLGLYVSFFRNFLANSGTIFGAPVEFGANSGNLSTAGVLPLMNLAVGLEVAAALALVIILVFTGGGQEND